MNSFITVPSKITEKFPYALDCAIYSIGKPDLTRSTLRVSKTGEAKTKKRDKFQQNPQTILPTLVLRLHFLLFICFSSITWPSSRVLRFLLAYLTPAHCLTVLFVSTSRFVTRLRTRAVRFAMKTLQKRPEQISAGGGSFMRAVSTREENMISARRYQWGPTKTRQ